MVFGTRSPTQRGGWRGAFSNAQVTDASPVAGSCRHVPATQASTVQGSASWQLWAVHGSVVLVVGTVVLVIVEDDDDVLVLVVEVRIVEELVLLELDVLVVGHWQSSPHASAPVALPSGQVMLPGGSQSSPAFTTPLPQNGELVDVLDV